MKFFEYLEGVKIGSMSLATLLGALVVFLICLAAIRIIKRIVSGIIGRSHLEKGLTSFINSVVSVGLWAVAIVIIAGTLGIPTASLVALLSVVGLALSLSVQGIMTNLFSGVTILVTRPFVAGQFVEIGGVSGTVSAIGMFHTQILTSDNRRIFIPNGDVTSAKIVNYSDAPLRRVEINVCASYDCPTQTVKDALLAAAKAVPEVLSEPGAAAYLLSYQDSNIEYTLRVWVNNADYWPVYFALTELVREKFDEFGVTMSYPQVKIIN